MQKYLFFIMYYGSALLLFTNILTGHCTSDHRSLLVCKISDMYIPLTVFEIQGFKLKNKNDKKKNWRNGLFAISPMRCQKWIITESESEN